MKIKFRTYSGWGGGGEVCVDTTTLPKDEREKIERLASGMKSERIVSGGFDMPEYDVEIETFKHGRSIKFHCDSFSLPSYAKELIEMLEDQLPLTPVPEFTTLTNPEIRGRK